MDTQYIDVKKKDLGNRGKLWTQEMMLNITGRDILLRDAETNVRNNKKIK